MIQQQSITLADDTDTWWLYLLSCADGRTYIGIALDVDARFGSHLRGTGAKFTRANKPVSVLGAQPCIGRSLALKAEYALKQLTRPEKLQWAQQWSYPPAHAPRPSAVT